VVYPVVYIITVKDYCISARHKSATRKNYKEKINYYNIVLLLIIYIYIYMCVCVCVCVYVCVIR
jgi:hypothetical protein